MHGVAPHAVDGLALEPAAPQLVYAVSKSIAKAFRRHGLPGFTAHSLRHTHASLLLSDGVPIVAVSQRLGHANPTITLNTYSHLVKRAEDQAAAVAGTLLANALAME
jgi:integrase